MHDFCDLPQELHIQILSHLDAVSLIRCAMTCTSFYDTLKSSSFLTCTVQLHLDGLKDAGTTLSHTDLIAYLTRRRRAWFALETNGPLTVQTQPYCEVCELAGGAFATVGSDHFEVIWLPTASHADGRTLRRPLRGISVAEFTMDPTQDLIVFLEDDGTPPSMTDTRIIRIHIHAISTNAIHPQAQQSPLQLTVVPKHDRANTYTTAVLQIAYGVVAVHFRFHSHNGGGEARALVWDWTTSDLLLDTSTSFDPPPPPLEYDFVLLDTTYFFVITAAKCGVIQLYKLVRSHAAPNQAIHLASLHLPPTAYGVAIDRIHTHAGPIEANLHPYAPFTVHDDHRLHMFTVQYIHPDSGRARPHYVNVFLHQRVLLKYARHARTVQEHVPLDIPWAEWGPPNTRVALFLPRQYVSHWRRSAYGQRAVLAAPYAVDVFDFSLAAVLSVQGILGAPAAASEIGKPGHLLPSSVIRTEDVPLFLDDVETHLPCVRSTLKLDACRGYILYAD
ncbi:hypothetical protein BJ912DRAFT_911666, partial [Pholiota molesta]